MEQAFMGGTPVVVNTGPRKEIRCGMIAVSKGRASGHFSSEWDSLEELADTLSVSCNEAFCETIPMSSYLMEPGLDWEFKVKARKFKRLMEKIDKEEDSFLALDGQEWESVRKCFEKAV